MLEGEWLKGEQMHILQFFCTRILFKELLWITMYSTCVCEDIGIEYEKLDLFRLLVSYKN